MNQLPLTKEQRAIAITLRDGGYRRETIASAFACMRCRQTVPANGIMYVRSLEMVCEKCAIKACADAKDDVHTCTACGEPLIEAERDQQHCGDGRSKCARRLRKMSEHESGKQDEQHGASAL